ncbi:hypothetical protein QJQ45_016310, partial [Haematococcus lacustris]
ASQYSSELQLPLAMSDSSAPAATMSLRDVVGFGSVAEYVGAGFFSSTATDNYDKLLFISATLFHTCAGIFVTPGYIASALTGPALFVSYLIAAGSAFLSSFCYAEFTVSIPMAGAAYNYIYSTLGEMIAWVTVSNLILEYILANAAVARGFAPYLALLFNKPSSYFIRSWNGYRLDGEMKNIFNGAAVSFFSFIGFDAIATTAEEMKDPARDMPIGILGAMSIVTAIYAMMCVTLSLMIPNGSIDSSAAFAAAFDTVGMQWAKYIVCIGALMGIFTGVMIGILGAARILTGCCRERMLPPILAWVSKSRQTPYVATIAIGMCSGGIALFSDFAELANMISIGTFIVFYFVAVGLLWFRCNVPGKTTFKGQCLLLLHTFAIIGFSLGFTLCWVLPTYADEVAGYDYNDSYVDPIPAGPDNQQQYKWLIAMAVMTLASTISMAVFCKQDFVPAGYKVPLFPGIPAASIFVNTFLLGQLDQKSYERFGWWTLAATCLYLFYGMVCQEAHDKMLAHKLQSLPSVEPTKMLQHDQSVEVDAVKIVL